MSQVRQAAGPLADDLILRINSTGERAGHRRGAAPTRDLGERWRSNENLALVSRR
jgi:hypothetical protein